MVLLSQLAVAAAEGESLRQDVSSLRAELSQGRVDEAVLQKLEAEYSNSKSLFESKAALLETKASAAIADKRSVRPATLLSAFAERKAFSVDLQQRFVLQADRKVKELQAELDELHQVLSEQQIVATRERDMLLAKHTETAAVVSKLEQRLREMEADARRQGVVAATMEGQLADRKMEQEELATARGRVAGLETELSQNQVSCACLLRLPGSALPTACVPRRRCWRLRRSRPSGLTALSQRWSSGNGPS